MTSPHDDLPPAFPEWLRRMFPTLRAEDTNALFQAFRRRREVYPPSGFAQVINKWTDSAYLMNALYALLLSALFAHLAWSNAVPKMVIAIPAIGILLLSAVMFFRRFSPRTAILPIRVSSVFGIYASSGDSARDVMTAGVRGRDVIEAIYLESMSASWKPALVLTACAACLPYLLIFPRENLGHPLLVLLAVFSTIWAARCFLNLSLLEAQVGVRDGKLRPRVILWESGAWEDTAGETLGRFLMHFLLFTGGLALVWMIAEFNRYAGTALKYPRVVGLDVSNSARWFMYHTAHLTKAIFVSIEVGVICWFLTWARAEEVQKSIRRLMDEADYTFEVFAARKICNDPGGVEAVRLAKIERDKLSRDWVWEFR